MKWIQYDKDSRTSVQKLLPKNEQSYVINDRVTARNLKIGKGGYLLCLSVKQCFCLSRKTKKKLKLT